MSTIFNGDPALNNTNVTKSYLNSLNLVSQYYVTNTLNPINANIKALQTDDATTASSITTITAAGTAEKARATAAESTIATGCTALITTSTTKATAAATTLTNQLAVQAAQITVLQNTITTLTTAVTAATATANQAQDRATFALGQSTQCNSTVNDIYNSNGGVLTVQAVAFKYTGFVIKPYTRYDAGSNSGNDLAIMNNDTSFGLDNIFGMYISSDGRCYMTDSNGNHQIAVQH